MAHEFLTDVKTLRERARQHIEKGAVTAGYKGEHEVVMRLLNEALATEIVCVLRYKRHYYMATGIHAQAVAAEFLEHANEEQGHADQIAARIVQLGGEPDLNPEGLHARSHSEYVDGENLLDMISEDLVAERDRDRQLRRDDPLHRRPDSTTRSMLEGILAMEEEHADDMANLLATLDPKAQARANEPMFMSSGKDPVNHAARCSRTLTPDRRGGDRRPPSRSGVGSQEATQGMYR